MFVNDNRLLCHHNTDSAVFRTLRIYKAVTFRIALQGELWKGPSIRHGMCLGCEKKFMTSNLEDIFTLKLRTELKFDD